MVQDVLLYWSDMWVLMPWMIRTLGAVHHRVAHQIMGATAVVMNQQGVVLPNPGVGYAGDSDEDD